MEIPDQLQCLFSAKVEERGESFLIEVPKREVHLDNLNPGEMYRMAILSASETGSQNGEGKTVAKRPRDPLEPPVEEGDKRKVEIEDIGDQGDGITRVERGFVVIVPDTEQGERVDVEITDVQENVAFAEVTERLSYYG